MKEPSLYEVSMVPNLPSIKIIEEGRTDESVEFEIYDVSFWLFDESCQELDWQSLRLSDGDNVNSILIPELELGRYYYMIRLAAYSPEFNEDGNVYFGSEEFELLGDTILTADVETYMTRMRVSDVSDFSNPDVERVQIEFGYSDGRYISFNRCLHPNDRWLSLSGGVDVFETYHPDFDFDSRYQTQYPKNYENLAFKFYDHGDQLLLNIPMDLEFSTVERISYTIEVDLESIWHTHDESRVEINIITTDWIEEVIVVD